MDRLTRRKFLIASGVAGVAAVGGGFTLKDILATSSWQDKPSGAKTLVLVTLYGGNDGLNTVIPYADSAYQAARGELAYQPSEVLKLDDTLGLNPAMKGLHALYTSRKLAVVRGVGYPGPDRSHFRSMDIWQTAQPDQPGTTGWLGRWLDATGGDPRHAVSFEPVLPPLLAGATTAGASVPLTGLSATPIPGAGGLGKPSAGEPAMQARAARSFADLIEVSGMITAVKEAKPSGSPTDPNDPATGTGGQAGALDSQLDLVAQCVRANVATRVFSVSLSGFDTHADEKATQQTQLGRLDTALSDFANQMAGHGVVTAVYTEFGRRVHANASEGTDHGTAGPMFLIGDDVRGGLHGTEPSLTDLDDGDLRYSTDFRSVYATLLARVLGADPARILNGYHDQLAGVI